MGSPLVYTTTFNYILRPSKLIESFFMGGNIE